MNWKELEALVRSFADGTPGLFVDRVIVPARPRHPEGYIKGEWAIRLTERRREAVLLISVRPRYPYVAWIEGKGPAAAEKGTRSPFDLALSKLIRGARVLGVELYPRERTLTLWMQAGPDAPGPARRRLGLALTLIPALPEALLIEDPGDGTADPVRGYPVLATSKQSKTSESLPSRFIPPDGTRAPVDPAVRTGLVSGSGAFVEYIDARLEEEAFEVRLRACIRALKEKADYARTRLRQNETAMQEAARESDWQRYGDLLKATLHAPPPLDADGTRTLQDWATGADEKVPCDPRLSPPEQIKKFYQLARRKQRRLDEARLRFEDARGALASAEKALAAPPATLDWSALEALEISLGLRSASGAPAAAKAAQARGGKHGGWQGKAFLSRDGWAIWVGRSRDENLELTFRHARGNDLWLHVRGRPGAHVVIPVQPGKSVPLETLLDAATLCLYYSNGESWGKTEVDYTFKKHVKRIKDSTEASYTNNKTLILQCEPARIQRLQQQQ